MISFNKLIKVYEEIKMQTQLLSYSILQRHKRKYQSDEITIFSHHCNNRSFRKSKQRRHNNEHKIKYWEKKRRIIEEAKTTSREQNAVNLSSKVLSPAEKYLLKKGSSFIPTPADINWCNLDKTLTIL